jgi:RNA polymerase sigma-70 factor (ECF subfamily)
MTAFDPRLDSDPGSPWWLDESMPWEQGAMAFAAKREGLEVVTQAAAEVPDELTDADLVERVRSGDGTAFRGLVERYQERVYTLVYGMVRNAEDAKDLTQDAFVKAYRKLDSFRLEASFYTWLYRIAMNGAIDHLRRRARRQESEYDDARAPSEEAEFSADHIKSNPGRDLERKQLYGRIMDAMETLSPEHRRIVLLREIEGLSYKEIADSLGLAEGTVMSRLFYARKKLQKALTDEQ